MKAPMIDDSQLNLLFSSLAEERRVALAVSGGPDSMALLLLADRWRRAQLDAGEEVAEFTVLTVDHGLRPEAAEECRFVVKKAKKLGHKARVLVWEGDKPKTRLQELARARRYQLLATACHSAKISLLMTAHHVEDQAETLLMRLGRGSGLDGLAAIPRKSRRYGLDLLRPLLDLSKQQLLEELQHVGWDYIEDPSNDDRRFERVRLRQCQEELDCLGLSPKMIGLSAKRLGRARRALEAARDSFLAGNAVFSSYGSARVDQLALSDVSEEVALRALARILRTCGGNLEPPGMAQLEQLGEALRDDFSSNHTLGGCRIIARGDFWLVVREAGRISELEKPISPGQCIFWDNRFIVCAGVDAPEDIHVGPLASLEGIKPLVDAAVLKKFPIEVLASLLSFRRKGEIIAVPALDYWDEVAIRAELTARFITVDEGLL